MNGGSLDLNQCRCKCTDLYGGDHCQTSKARSWQDKHQHLPIMKNISTLCFENVISLRRVQVYFRLDFQGCIKNYDIITCIIALQFNYIHNCVIIIYFRSHCISNYNQIIAKIAHSRYHTKKYGMIFCDLMKPDMGMFEKAT